MYVAHKSMSRPDFGCSRLPCQPAESKVVLKSFVQHTCKPQLIEVGTAEISSLILGIDQCNFISTGMEKIRHLESKLA